jgi:hypothetical protein
VELRPGDSTSIQTDFRAGAAGSGFDDGKTPPESDACRVRGFFRTFRCNKRLIDEARTAEQADARA